MSSSSQTPFSKPFAVIGFFSGLVFAWNATENALAALFVGIVAAALASALGNFVWRVLVILISVALAVLSFGVRQAAVDVAKEAVASSSYENSGSPPQAYVQPEPEPEPAPEPPEAMEWSEPDEDRSAWRVCNKTSVDKISVAISHWGTFEGEAAWINQGWYNLDPDECHTFSQTTPKTSNLIYLYADTSDGHWAKGDAEMCVDHNNAFTLLDEPCDPPLSKVKTSKVKYDGDGVFTYRFND